MSSSIPEAGKNLSYFCKSHSSFKTKLGILSLYKAHFPAWFERILLTIEYLQLFSLTIFIHPAVSEILESDAKHPLLFEIISYSLKLANPSYLLSFTHNDQTTIAILGIILGYILFKYLLISYVFHVSWFNKRPHTYLKIIWRWIFKLQGRMACCFLTSFWVRTIVMTSNDSFSIQGINNQALMGVSAFLIIIEYFITFLIETQLCNFMPTRGYLAAKNFEMQITTLTQKLVIQVIQLIAYKNLSVSLWVCIILNLIISFIREFRFFTTLPLYNFKALLYQGDLAAFMLSLNIAQFFQRILIETDYSQDTDFRSLVLLWIIVGIMSTSLSRTSVKHIFRRLLTSYHPKENPNLLLHKIFATKYLIQATKVPTKGTDKTDLKHLIGVTQNLNLSEVFNFLEFKEIPYHTMMDGGKEAAMIFLEHLEKLSFQFPRNSLIKFHLAYQSFKSTALPSKIIKLTSKLNKNLTSPYHMSSALLLYELEIKNLQQFSNLEEDTKKNLDLMNYLDNQIAMQDIRSHILKQIALRKQVCENIIGERANLETIYQNSQVIHQSRKLIQKKINSFLKRAPDQYLHPLLVFAEYSLHLNYSIEDYHNYYENYSRKYTRFAKEFDLNNLKEENLYQDENAFLLIGIDELANNSILYATKSLQNICGTDRNNYINAHLTRLFPRGLREYYDQMIKEIFEKGNTEFTNKSFHAFLTHKEGWLIEADIFMRVHPYMSQNLYIDLFIRPHRAEVTDAILLDETGKIEGATQHITQLTEIDKLTSVHIRQISSELCDLNRSFNIINQRNNQEVDIIKKTSSSKSKKSSLVSSSKLKTSVTPPDLPPLDNEKAYKILNMYNEERKSIEFKIGKDPHDKQNRHFRCSISLLDFSTFSLNFIRLESVSRKRLRGRLRDNSISYESSLQDLDDLQERPQLDDVPLNLHSSMTTRDRDRGQSLPTNNDAPNPQYEETEENLISPTSSRLFFKTQTQGTKITQPPVFQPDVMNQNSSVNTRIGGASTAISVGSTASKISQISGVFKTFHLAIHTQSRQRSFNFLCLIFYGVILGTLICQIALKNVLDTTMDRLITKTNLLNYAQRRVLQISTIHNNARGCKLTIDGLIASSDLVITDASLRSSMSNTNVSEAVLTESNVGIANNIDSEDHEIQQMLFTKDITIKGNWVDPTDNHTVKVTQFQHGDIMRDVTKYLWHLPLVASKAGGNAFAFILNNAANDFLVKNQEIVDAFQNSVDQQKENLQSMISLLVIVLPILLAGIVCLLSAIIVKQYIKEKRHLLAFLKLNPAMIQHILENLQSFEKRLIHQEKLKEELIPKLIYKLEKATQFASYHKGHDSQIIISREMQKRYFWYIFKVLFYIALLIGIVILNYVLITKSINGIYKQQQQIQFANKIGSTVSVTYNAFTESFVTNNTNYVMGEKPFDLWTKNIKKVGQIQEEMYSAFQLDDGTYDPDVKAILFDQINCSVFTAASNVTCVSLNTYGIPTSLVSTINLYKNMLDIKYAQYLAVSKASLGLMIVTALKSVSYILAGYRVSASSSEILSDLLSEKLTYKINNIYDLATTILVVFSLTLVIVSVLIWFQILTKVKKVNDDFKKVLAVLPPNIVLSSFLLKTFLSNTSNIRQRM